jgi:hypothetical protein
MDRRPIRVLSVLLVALAGCSFLYDSHKTTYETVQADPHHDTELAEAEHAKALEIMNGGSLCKSCDPAKAEEHLQQALVADVTYGPAHNSLATLYLRQCKFYLAAWEFQYAAKLMPDRFEPLYNLGLVYESTDKLDRAIEFYTMAFSIAPRNPNVLESLVRARLRNGETVADVRELLKEILFYETRPVWIAWARDELGLAPEKLAQIHVPATPTPVDERSPDRGPTALPVPPAPDATPTVSPKVAPRLPLPDHAVSSTDGAAGGLSSERGPAESSGPSGEPLLIPVGRPKRTVSHLSNQPFLAGPDAAWTDERPAQTKTAFPPTGTQSSAMDPGSGRIHYSDDESDSGPAIQKTMDRP